MCFQLKLARARVRDAFPIAFRRSGAAINSNAVGMHTITGAVVKIN